MLKKIICIMTIALATTAVRAQVGDYRNVWSVGVNGGVALNQVRFMPEVPQDMYQGSTFGIVGRYTSEKYFSTICALQVECNVTKMGWKEKIQTIERQPVLNPETGVAEEYQRNQTYVQIPLLARLAWGKEKRGLNAYFIGGPQIGFLVKESIDKNYDKPFIQDNFPDFTGGNPRASNVTEQETMDVKNKFDYGITFGGGVEWDIRYVGRLSVEGRYYYGLGNLYGDSKKDVFSRSPHGTIYIRMGWMHDL